MSKRFACAYIPDFSIDLVMRDNPSIARKPFALTADCSGRRLIVAVNERAAMAGISRNMTIAQSRSLCRNLLTETRNFEKEKAASAEIVQALQNVGPSVQEVKLGVYFLDTSGLTLLYRSEKMLAERIISAVRAKLFPVKVGVGKNMFLARVAAEVSRVSGFTIVTAGTENKFLRDIPIDHLDVSREVLEKFHVLGINRVGEVAGFGENELALRFKVEGTKLRFRSKGDDPELFSPESLPKKISRRILLTYSVYKSEAVILYVEKLLGELIEKINDTGHAVDNVMIHLRLESRGEISFRVRLDKPSVNVSKFVRKIEYELDKFQLEAGVNEIKVTIASILPQVSEQLELHKMEAGTNVLTKGNLINIPDFGRLCLPELRNSFLPERKFRFPNSHRKMQKRCVDRQREWGHPYAMSMISGLRLFDPPKEARVIMRGTVPRAVVFGGASRSVKKFLGPWQISGEWWNEGFERFYFEIETDDKKFYLLYYDKLSSRWFIHGIFD